MDDEVACICNTQEELVHCVLIAEWLELLLDSH